jgi:hypothetical protein
MTPLLPGLLGWLIVSAAAGLVWRLRERPIPTPPVLTRLSSVVIILALAAVTQLGVAILAFAAPPADPVMIWVGLGCAAVSAVITGGAVTNIVLSLADTTTPTTVIGPAGARIKRELLRGGTWIGILERIGILTALLTSPGGVGLILAIKGLARYPELKAGPTSGAAERFIIGTLISFGWAAGCAGIGWLILH